MSLFNSIMSKIFGSAGAAEPAPNVAPAQAAPQASAQVGAPAARVPAQAIDVTAVLTQMASQKKGGGGNWKTSIVDLLKLLELDSSLGARQQLAAELNVQAGAAGTAEQNIALHKAVMRKLAENGGKVPDSMKD